MIEFHRISHLISKAGDGAVGWRTQRDAVDRDDGRTSVYGASDYVLAFEYHIRMQADPAWPRWLEENSAENTKHCYRANCSGYLSTNDTLSPVNKKMSNVTQLIQQLEKGDRSSQEQLLSAVYEELRRLAAVKIAGEKPGQTLQATALVHEAYLRLVAVPQSTRWNGRAHFFGAAAEAMRRILVENARRKGRIKHGGGMQRQELEPEWFVSEEVDLAELLDVHAGLDALATKAPRKAELVKLRYFLGMTNAEAAQLLGIAPATAEDDWRFSKAWLKRFLSRRRN